MTQLPPIVIKSNAEFFESQEQFARLIQANDGRAVAEFIRSGAYEQYTLLNSNDENTNSDLFYQVVRGKPAERHSGESRTPTPQFRVDAFQAFIDDGSVFAKPYGMLGVLWRTWTYAAEFYLIIVSLIPDETWRQMTTAILENANGDPRFRFRFPAGHFPMLMLTCARWGRHANTLAQQVALQAMIDEYARRDDIWTVNKVEIWDIATQLIERMRDNEAPLQAALRDWFRDARRRLCYRDITSLMLGFVATKLNTEELLGLVRFTLPCYDEHIIGRIDAVRIIDRVRTAAIEAEDRRALRNVERR